MTSIDVLQAILVLLLPLGVFLVVSNARGGVQFDSPTVRAWGIVLLGVLGTVVMVLRLVGVYELPE